MRILNISNNYHNSSLWKNMHRAYEDLYPEEAFFVSFNHKGASFENQYEVYDFPVLTRSDRFLFFKKISKCFRALKSSGKLEGVDCIHAHTLFSDGAVAYKAWKERGIPYIISIRNTDMNTFYRLKPYLKPYADKILIGASSIICLAPSYKEQLLSKVATNLRPSIESKIVIVPNGIDPFWFSHIYADRPVPEAGCVRLVTAGQVEKNKNQATVVKACEALIPKGYDVEYHLAGKVADEEYYSQFEDKPFVKYHGALDKEQLSDLYRQCDIFVLASRFETFGLVYAEALTQGLPIIYSKGQGFDGQFPEGEVGYAVPCYDDEVITGRILDVVASYDKLSANAVRLCHKFETGKVVTTFHNLLSKAVGSAN